MKTRILAGILLFVLALTSCSNDPVRKTIAHKDIYKRAYIYGFPMIAAYKAMYQFNVDKENPQYKGPFNTIINEARVFTPKDTSIVSPNSDTPYSMLQADLRAEPVVLCVPAVEKDRYYSVMMADMYAQNYGYVGSRATAGDPGCYMIAGPGWKGSTPAGIKKVFNSETQFSLVIYRTQLFNPADMPKVKKIQAGYTVQVLSSYLKQPAPPAPSPIEFPTSESEGPSKMAVEFPVFVGDDPFKLQFPKYLNFLMQFCPELPSEKDLRAQFSEVGIAPGQPFDLDKLPEEEKAELALAVDEGFHAIKQQVSEIGKNVNGWSVAAAFGDRAFYKGNYLLRAGAAMAGIYGNDAVEAMYPLAKSDATGAKLDGSKHNYTITFPAGQLPPVNAFWSVTMYDGNTQLLIENPINRYLINSPMLGGMKKSGDGSLTIYVQKDAPTGDKKANWLPAPNGPIYMVMRLYWPKTEPPSILPPGEGTWKPPAIEVAER